MSDFNPDAFLSAQQTVEVEDKYPTIPDGEYQAVADKVNVRQSQDGKYTFLDVTWAIDDPTVKEETGLDHPSARQSVFLDIEKGQLATGKGKNVQLGRLLAAVGIDTHSGKPWSMQDVVGRPALVRVTTRSTDDGRTYNDVSRVAPLA